jgi:hypothetical protein
MSEQGGIIAQVSVQVLAVFLMNIISAAVTLGLNETGPMWTELNWLKIQSSGELL